MDSLFEKRKTYKVVIKRSDTERSIYTLTVTDETADFVEGTDKYGLQKMIAKNAIIEIDCLEVR